MLATPCLLLDRAKLKVNIKRMRDHLARLGVPLRPHVKTCKNIEIARMALEGQPGGITVSTLAEADYFFGHGITDILYAVGIGPGKLDEIARRRAAGMSLTIILDHRDTASTVARAARRLDCRFRVLLEIDADGQRAGFAPDDPELAATAETLGRANCDVAGVMVHAGGSYHCNDVDCIRDMAARERDAAVAAAGQLRASGFEAPIVSVGSTPTAVFADKLDGVSEVRAGVYMFQDLVMSGLGVCRPDDIAISVLTEIIGQRRDAGQAIVDAGWTALSRDRGTADQAVDQGYGLVCDEGGNPLDDIIVTATNQEHGIVGRRDGTALDIGDFRIGTRLRILPNHACATAAQHGGYHLINGTGEAEAYWERIGGW